MMGPMLAFAWKCCVLAWVEVIFILAADFNGLQLRRPLFLMLIITSCLGSVLGLILGELGNSYALAF